VKKIFSFLYYLLGSHLPNSNYPAGNLFSLVRVFFLRLFLSSIGKKIVCESNVFFGDGRDIQIGNNVQINENCWIRNCRMGNDIMIGPYVMILNYGHITDDASIPMIEQGVRKYKQTVIEDDVWIGARAMILPGIKISKGSIIGAGSIVTKDVAEYSVVAGNPAKFIKSRK